ncbi:MAG: tetratricopeptide repeat protein [Nostoc sp. ChiQUE01a]|nr:tetratricopeptide repeat protein [Nostoc sp. ChiQUE01a]
MLSPDSTYSLTEADKAELKKLVSVLELSSGTKIIFAIAPESSPQHSVVRQLQESLATSDEKFEFNNFFYSQNSFHNFLYSLDDRQQQNLETGRKLVMAFGIDQLPTPRLVKEMKQLNLGREELFGRNLVLILWLNNTDFLDEFRQRAPDFWDWRGKIVEFETHNPLLYPYLEWLIAENSYLKMSGVMQVNRQVDIFLDQIYVSLQAQWRQQITDTSECSQSEIEVLSVRQVQGSSRLNDKGSSLDDWNEPCYYEPLPKETISASISNTKTVTQKVDLSEAVRENCYSVILGAPGAGKTTLLRYLALHFAIAKRENLETVIVDDAVEDNNKKELGKTLLPIFFRIADYAEKLKQQPELTLLEYLHQFYRQWEVHFQAQGEIETEVAGLLLDAMRQGKCLMLLDGLDEVFDQESRKQIVERINKFVDEFSSNKFVITSRIAGYRDVQLSSRFAEFTIEDMDSGQVEWFLYRWCRTVEKAQQPDASEEEWLKKGTEQAQEILQAVKDNPGVQRLTANPLLLTILALIHRNGDRLPNRRVKLYELAVQTLTEEWQLRKKLPDAPRVVLKETEVVELLAPLAYWMHEEKPSGLVTQREVEEKLAEKLAELNDTAPESDSVRQAVGEFLRKVRETTGLFVERMPGFYGFMHLTFEEYFVSRYIANIDDFNEQLSLINSHLHEPRWNEPILLALGHLSGLFSQRANKLVEKIFDGLYEYKPAIENGDIKIKKSLSQDEILCFPVVNNNSNLYEESALVLKNLMFVGQVLNQVELQGRIRLRLIEKLIITYLGLPELYGNEIEDRISNQLLKLFRKIEEFIQKDEVVDCLKKLGNNPSLPQWKRMKVPLAYLHIACSKSGKVVINLIDEIVESLNPFIFGFIVNTCGDLGEELTVTLEKIRENLITESASQQYINFIIALSYIRKNHYKRAIYLLEEYEKEFFENKLEVLIIWALAICYRHNDEPGRAVNYYKQAYEQLNLYPEPYALSCFWQWWSITYLSDGKYKQALDCWQNSLKAAQRLNWSNGEAFLLNYIVDIYRQWEKYDSAIEYLRKKYEIYHQSGQQKEAADYLYEMANCYREWGKYEQAVECENQCLTIRQQLNGQGDIANAYYQLGRIYQDWGKYEQAINYYQQSRELYQQLGKDKNVANLWSWLGDCYREWSKYQQAINYYQQSRKLYQQLGKDNNVANQWKCLANCYRESCK